MLIIYFLYCIHLYYFYFISRNGIIFLEENGLIIPTKIGEAFYWAMQRFIEKRKWLRKWLTMPERWLSIDSNRNIFGMNCWKYIKVSTNKCFIKSHISYKRDSLSFGISLKFWMLGFFHSDMDGNSKEFNIYWRNIREISLYVKRV